MSRALRRIVAGKARLTDQRQRVHRIVAAGLLLKAIFCGNPISMRYTAAILSLMSITALTAQVPWMGQVQGCAASVGSWPNSVYLDHEHQRFIAAWTVSVPACLFDHDLRQDIMTNHFGGGNRFALIGKYDAANAPIWTGAMVAANWAAPVDIVGDEEGGAYVAGLFYAGINVQPADGINLVGANNQLLSGPVHDLVNKPAVFLCRLSADGELLWKTKLGTGDVATVGMASYGYMGMNSMVVRSDGKLVVIGRIHGYCDFDPDTSAQVTAGSNDYSLYIWTLNPDGTLYQVRTIATNIMATAYGASLGADDELYITGRGTPGMDMDPGPQIASFGSTPGAYLASYNATGDLRWFRKLEADTTTRGLFTACRNERVAVAGLYRGTVDMDPGSGTDLRTSLNNEAEPYIQYYDRNGTYQGADVFPATAATKLSGLDITEGGGILLCGDVNHYGTIDLDPSVNTMSTPVDGFTHGFLVCLGADRSYQWAHSFRPDNQNVRPLIDMDYTDGELILGASVNNNIYVSQLPLDSAILFPVASPQGAHNLLLFAYGPDFALAAQGAQPPPAPNVHLYGDVLTATVPFHRVELFNAQGQLVHTGASATGTSYRLPELPDHLLFYRIATNAGWVTGALARP